MASERLGLVLARVSVSYALLARGLLGSVDEDEASEYHVKGLATDEVLFFVAECVGEVSNLSLDSLIPRSTYKYYLETAARSGFRGLVGIPLDSMSGFLIFMSALAEAELRGDDTVSSVRLRLYEEVVNNLIEAMKSRDEPCLRSLAAAIESVAREDLEVLGG